MNEGYIKLHRRLLKWEWSDSPQTLSLWLHLLLRANYVSKEWHGILITRGQLLTSLNQLSKATGLSVRQIRTSLNRLKLTGEIASKATNKYSLITICKYDDYQLLEVDERQTKRQSNRQTSDKQATTTNKYKERKEYNKESISNDILKKDELSLCSPDYQKFIIWIKDNAPYVYQHLALPTETEFFKLKKNYSGTVISNCISEIENRKDLRKRYTNLYRTLLNWLKFGKEDKHG